MCSGCVDRAAGWDVAVPGDAGADADAAFVDRALAGAQRAVAGDLPGRGPAVVAGEEDQRVVAHALLIQRGDDLADRLVHRRDHAGIGAARRRQVARRARSTVGGTWCGACTALNGT